MSMMWPPHRVKMVSIPSAFSALATRWPPEMVWGCSGCCAWSAPTGVFSVSLTSGAIFAMIRLLTTLSRMLSHVAHRSGEARPPLVQIMDVRGDVRCQVQGVLPHETLCQLRLALLQGLDNMHVVDDRARDARIVTDRAAPDRAHVDKERIGGLAQKIAAAHLDDALVEVYVCFRVFIQVGFEPAVLKRREDRTQRGDLLVARMQRDQTGSHALERRPDRDDLQHLLLALADDEGAAAGYCTYQALELEPDDRLANGGPADAKVFGQPALVQAQILGAVVNVHGCDGLLQRLIRQIRYRQTGINRLQGQSRACRRHPEPTSPPRLDTGMKYTTSRTPRASSPLSLTAARGEPRPSLRLDG